jgi:hypothetical protein
MVLPLEPTDVPGVYRRGSRYVVVYRGGGRQRKQAAATLAEARAIKLARDAEARAERRGRPCMRSRSAGWIATPARVATASGRTRAASTAGCWRRSRCATSTASCVCAISTVPLCRGSLTGSRANRGAPAGGATVRSQPGGCWRPRRWMRRWLRACSSRTPPTAWCCRGAVAAARGSSRSDASSRGKSSRGCWTRCRQSGGRCLTCSP